MDDERPPPPAAPVPPDDREPVRLVRVGAGWAGRYATVATELAAALGDALAQPGGMLLEVHHVGSTAVPGLLAKPTLDVMARLAPWPPEDEARRRLARLGYRDHGQAGEPDRRFLARGGHATHLHLVGPGRGQLRRHLALRELLLRDPAARARYEACKARLVRRHAGRRDAYVEGKDALVRALEAEALAAWPVWRGGASGAPPDGREDGELIVERARGEAGLAALQRAGLVLGDPRGGDPWRPGAPLPPGGRLLGRVGPLVAPSPAARSQAKPSSAGDDPSAPARADRRLGPWFVDVLVEAA
jgi:GrpB-like predicted nucleotidyltransferase (UPF0157 family)